jgi:hypothetical protein
MRIKLVILAASGAAVLSSLGVAVAAPGNGREHANANACHGQLNAWLNQLGATPGQVNAALVHDDPALAGDAGDWNKWAAELCD